MVSWGRMVWTSLPLDLRTELTFMGLAFLLLIARGGCLLSIDTGARRAAENGESLVQAGQSKNPHHRFTDVEQGKSFPVLARGGMGFDQVGDAGAIDLGDGGHVDQQVLSAGKASEKLASGFPGMVKIDRVNDVDDGFRWISELQI